MRALTLVSIVVVAACGRSSSGQTFEQGVAALCDLPRHVPENLPYEQRLAGVAEWGAKNITNPEARAVGDASNLGHDTSKAALTSAVAKGKLQHCLLLENDMEMQSFADAMKLACESTATDPAWFKSHVWNGEVGRLVSSLGNLAPADRTARLDEAMKRAGLASCTLLEATPVNK